MKPEHQSRLLSVFVLSACFVLLLIDPIAAVLRYNGVRYAALDWTARHIFQIYFALIVMAVLRVLYLRRKGLLRPERFEFSAIRLPKIRYILFGILASLALIITVVLFNPSESLLKLIVSVVPMFVLIGAWLWFVFPRFYRRSKDEG